MRSLRCAARALPLFMVLLGASARAAGDPAVTAFKQDASQQLGDVKSAAKSAVKTLKSTLSSISKSYAAGQSSFDEAMAASVAAVSSARDELEDASFGGLSTLAAQGHQLLLDAGVTAGPDFQAGGQGVWDQALFDTQDALDGADVSLRAAYATFLKSMAKAGKKLGVKLDVRAQLPPHGEAFWSITPPGGVPATLTTDGGPPTSAPQILIVARFVETGTPDTLRLGLRASAASVDVLGSSTSSDEQLLGPLVPDASGLATGTFTPAPLAHAAGFVVLHLFDGTLSSPFVAVSAPHLLVPDPNADAPLAAFKKSLKDNKKLLTQATGDAAATLKDVLNTEADGLTIGMELPSTALRNGFARLQEARDTVAVAWQAYVAATAGAASLALQTAAIDDGALPPDFQPDVAGLAATSNKAALKQVDLKQAQITKSFDTYVEKVRKTGEKQHLFVDASWTTGRNASFAAPMVSSAPTLPRVPITPPRVSDGLLLVVPVPLTGLLSGPVDFSVLLDVQADFGQYPSLEASSQSIPSNTLTSLGTFTLDPGGTNQKESDLPEDTELGWLFRVGATATDQPAAVVLTKPDHSGD